jgi:hypothetical protein
MPRLPITHTPERNDPTVAAEMSDDVSAAGAATAEILARHASRRRS